MRNKHFHRLPPLSRRTVLRGTLGGLGVAIALPTLESMLNSHGTAFAQGMAFPKRFGFYFFGDGVRLDEWTPATTGAGYTLTTALAPLMNVKDYVSVVSGTAVRPSGQGHHTGQCALATSAPYIEQDPGGAPYASTYAIPSIDQVIASAWEAQQPMTVRSLELGLSERLNRNEGTTLNFFSHTGPDAPNQPEYDPRAVFDRLFTDGFTPGTSEPVPPDPRWALRKSVLDAVKQGAAELNGRLGRTDKLRLEQHMDSLRTIENKLTALQNGQTPASASCLAPMQPADLPDPDEGEPLLERTELHSDLLAMALACDLTRVFSIQFSCGTSSTVFPTLNISTGRHSLSHDEGDDQPGMKASTVYIMERFATFLEKLMGVTEGTGNVLDSCAIMASTDVAEGLPHSKDDYPVLVVGGAGAGLVHPGIHYRSEDEENTTNIHYTVVTALGLGMTSVGADEGMSSTTIPALLAV